LLATYFSAKATYAQRRLREPIRRFTMYDCACWRVECHYAYELVARAVDLISGLSTTRVPSIRFRSPEMRSFLSDMRSSLSRVTVRRSEATDSDGRRGQAQLPPRQPRPRPHRRRGQQCPTTRLGDFVEDDLAAEQGFRRISCRGFRQPHADLDRLHRQDSLPEMMGCR